MKHIKHIYGQIDPHFLIRSYLFSIAVAVFVFSLMSEGPLSTGAIILMVLDTALYPFADLLWSELVSLIMGNTIIALPFVFMIIWKIIRIFLLWWLSVVIAPIMLDIPPYQKIIGIN